MTTAAPRARYGAVEGALASGFATAELHHVQGHDLFGSDLLVLKRMGLAGPYACLRAGKHRGQCVEKYSKRLLGEGEDWYSRSACRNLCVD
ncbi:hypothetical protein [Ensifer canadensis]|uniref:hypothetical protein n=1 Tax=Ensifer canadensis TaxID=555315 RepID=UPI0035E3CB55